MKKVLILIAVFLILLFVFKIGSGGKNQTVESPEITERVWVIKSIDTMKYSRDLSLEKLNDGSFDQVIARQVKAIKDANATHVAIGTPYDEKFIPILKRWVKAARKNDLQVWFRGNFSGWEGWFGYEKDLTRDEHLALMRQFINENGDLFENEDLFTPCPECENGGAGDPRHNGDINGFRQFMIEEFQAANTEFRIIGKNVKTVGSLNYDVASLVMDEQTANKVGDLVVVDHYVKEPEKLASDIDALGRKTHSKILLGEFGVPIPDIHGEQTEEWQAVWIDQALRLIGKQEAVIGVNYWVGVGGSTAIFNKDNTSKPAAEILKKYFKLNNPTSNPTRRGL